MIRDPRPLLLSCLSLAILLTGLTSQVVRADADDYELGYIQIQAAAGVTVNQINLLYGTSTSDSLPPLYRLYVPHGVSEDALIQQMRLDPQHVAAAEHCFRSNTPEAVRQMVVAAVGGTIGDYLDQNVVARLHLAEAQHFNRGEGVVVAVLDTGVNLSHPALAGVLLTNGWDFVDGDADPSDIANGLDDDKDGQVDEGAGHGTMVAGIVHLVAPNARVLPIRVLNDEGRGQTFQVARGIRYAREHGAKIINLSLGLRFRSEIIAHEMDGAHEYGLAIVAAAGNDGTDSLQVYPASDSSAFMVAALDSADVKADFSNYGTKVEVSAPGVGIRAPYFDGEWAIGAGTSFAAPFVAGECALLLSMDPDLAWSDLLQRVRESVVDIYEFPPNQPFIGELGTGRIDGYELLIHSDLTASNGEVDRRSILPLRVWPNPALAGRTVHVAWDGLSVGTMASRASVFDARGRLVAPLQTPSTVGGELAWDGRDRNGRLVPAGLYYVKAPGTPPATRGASVLIVR